MTYGATIAEMGRRAAAFVSRTLNGSYPGTLPIEPPTVQLAINLGLCLSPPSRLRADQVLE